MVNVIYKRPRKNKANRTQFLAPCRSGDRRSREGDTCETKPISAGTMRAKQTQFASEGHGRPSPKACPERGERAFSLDDATLETTKVQNEPNLGSSGFSVLAGYRPPTRGRCPRTPGIFRFGPMARQEDPETRLSWGRISEPPLRLRQSGPRACREGRVSAPEARLPLSLSCNW
jgi:hypothetical protein